MNDHDVGHLVAVADDDLRVVLGGTELASALDVERPLRGESLLELFPRPDVRRELELLRAGVAREVRLATFESDRCLVATLLTGGDVRSIHVHDRPLPPLRSAATDVFVGRAEQLEAFDAFLASPDGTMFVIEGPLGIGKSAFMLACSRRCQKLKTPLYQLDARGMSFEGDALQLLATLHNGAASILRLAGEFAGRPWVLLLDHFDVGLASSIERRAAFFRSLPKSCRVVVAVRSHVKPFAAIFPHHRPLVCRLGPLSPSEAEALAAHFGVDPQSVAVREARGHPLSIRALAPSVAAIDPLDDLAYQGDFPAPRAALKVAALPSRITEDLLARLLEDEGLAARTYDALGTICMTDPDNLGLRMPQVLRRTLTERLQRRNPARYAALRLEITRHLLQRLDERDGRGAAPIIDDLFDSFRDHHGLHRLFGTPDSGVIVRRVTRDPPDSARAFLRACAGGDAPSFLARLRSGTPTFAAERDGAIAGMMQFAVLSSTENPSGDDRRRAAVRSLFTRFVGVSEVRIAAQLAFVVPDDEKARWGDVAQALVREHLRMVLMHRGLAAVVVPADLGWGTIDLVPPADEIVEVDGIQLHVRDLRRRSVPARLLAALETDETSWHARDPRPRNVAAISTDAVRLALSNLDRGSEDTSLREAIDALSDDRQREILRAIYVDRRGKHELIAADMGIPYSTFRRHHTRGLERIRELLIERASTDRAGPSNP